MSDRILFHEAIYVEWKGISRWQRKVCDFLRALGIHQL